MIMSPHTWEFGATLSAACAALLAALGLEGQPLFWAMVGSVIGMSFAASTTKVRMYVVLVAVVLMCSLFGVWIADHYFNKEQVSKNAVACVLAIWFHPLLNLGIAKLPTLFDKLVQRWFPER